MTILAGHGLHIRMDEPVPDIVIAGIQKTIRDNKYARISRNFYSFPFPFIVDDISLFQTCQQFIQIILLADSNKVIGVQPADNSVLSCFFLNHFIVIPQRRISAFSPQIAVNQGKTSQVVADGRQVVKLSRLKHCSVMVLKATQVPISGVIVKRQHLNHISVPVAT